MIKKCSIFNFLGGKNFSNELIYQCYESLNYDLMEYGINEYEENIRKLKEDINVYNKTAEHIKGDIYRLINVNSFSQYNL